MLDHTERDLLLSRAIINRSRLKFIPREGDLHCYTHVLHFYHHKYATGVRFILVRTSSTTN